jgi:hypothetical protein
MEKETTVMERENINFYFLLKKEKRELRFSFFFGPTLTSNYMLIKSSWHSCWIYSKSIVLANTILNTNTKKQKR